MKKTEQFARLVKSLQETLKHCEAVAPDYDRIMTAMEDSEATLSAIRRERELELKRLQAQIDALTADLEKKRAETKASEVELTRRITDAEERAVAAQEKADASARGASEDIARSRREHEAATAALVADRTRLQQDVDKLRLAVARLKKETAAIQVEV